jgi:hypothetical protein
MSDEKYINNKAGFFFFETVTKQMQVCQGERGWRPSSAAVEAVLGVGSDEPTGRGLIGPNGLG